jgi:hypothetical protein
MLFIAKNPPILSILKILHKLKYIKFKVKKVSIMDSVK